MLDYCALDCDERLISLLARNFMHPYVSNIFKRHGIEKTTEAFSYHIHKNVLRLLVYDIPAIRGDTDPRF